MLSVEISTSVMEDNSYGYVLHSRHHDNEVHFKFAKVEILEDDNPRHMIGTRTDQARAAFMRIQHEVC